MTKRPARKNAQAAEPVEHRAVVVGWTHHGLGSSIDLRLQSTTSQRALDDNQIDSHHFLMTHNQALLLANYLLDATGQTLPQRVKPSIWRRFLPKRQK